MRCPSPAIPYLLPPLALAIATATVVLPEVQAQVQAMPPTMAPPAAAEGGQWDRGPGESPAARITGARAVHLDPVNADPSGVVRPASASMYRDNAAPPYSDPGEYGFPVTDSRAANRDDLPSYDGIGPNRMVDQSVLQRSLDLPSPDSDPTSHIPTLGGGDLSAISAGRYDPPLVSAPATCAGPSCYADRCWTWQLVPDGVLYKSYIAGPQEPRLGATWFQVGDDADWYWDSTVGTRVGLLRYGSRDATWAEGWQLDAEGAAYPRLTLDEYRDLVSSDFRFGFPLTYRSGPWEAKFGYYHLSSHLADEYLERYPDASRINFVRETLTLGLGWRPHPDWRLYSEAGYAVYAKGGSKPWEFQFGAEYSPAGPTGFWGAPFIAVNGHLREENDFGGNVTARAGFQWRGRTGNALRLGAHYLNGTSNQYQFFQTHEEQFGIGLWHDY